ncbi:ATPase, T2SS/T4P/T4SS family [Bdellovibrio bacteriovorus]|uniref:Flp pilus assembling protein n=2 Tax=Bdellovibrio bacteriovorus TaxID=959 RepID=Q68VD9_BDEBC|nr:ATPase, T2SS/T4P/T4SS family [Bdellovibrio bacteriovorus]AHZ85761.1 pilus assembly protein TadA [Bdellovibrio bacteriovorus]BEV66681.1 Iron-sulfur cluster carrier protein [Bdellovibrio bacteriovorus]CAE47780.1 flp pilus assembling protein [Bdellovibrio bacteriovorus]CAE77785.1 Flp pilus assembly protein TadA [Bdellovibrio bacteriovorus HD100]
MAINPNCNLIAVVGGKGGVGKSVFAANFACTIMNELRSQVLLIDADARSVGDQNVIMGLKPQKTLKELASFQGSLNSQPMNTLVTMHQSGLAYLGAVRGPEESLNINPDLLGKLVEFFSRAYKFIIVDVGTELGPAQMAVLQEATAIMIVTTPEVLVVTQTQRLVNELLSATLPKDMFQLVINKASPTGLSPQTISNQLQLPFLGIIPQDEATSMMSLQKYTPFVISAPKAPVTAAYYDVARKLTGGILQRLKTLSRPKPAPAAAAAAGDSASTGSTQGMDARTLLKIRIHNELIRTVDLKKLLVDGKQDENKEKEVREKTKREITLIVDREAPDVAREERSKLIKEVLEEALGLGPLEDLLADPDVTEIMVNGNKRVFVEKSGKVQLSPVTFTSNDHLRRIIERIVTPLGRQINDSTPYVDARLKDGSRVNAVIEPLAIDGPALTIRKFKKGGITAEKYIGYGSITKNMIDFLRICVENGLNVVISGGTGSGKTSLLNMLSSFIPSNERVITVEDAAELQLQQEHVVRLETRPASMEGSNAIHIRDLIKNALRMRPDRIIVGECRDGAALDMLQAMNTGHDGSMTTTHANSPRECVARLETLCMMSGMDLPMRAIREQIAGAVNLIVQISRLSDGSRKILSITEVAGMQGDVVTLAEIFRFKETGYDKNRKIQGVFQATGTIPSFIQKLSDKGVVIPREIFANDPNAGTPAAAAAAKPPIPAAMAPKMPGVAPVKKSG